MQIVARRANSDSVGGRRKSKTQTLGVDVDLMTPLRVESTDPSSQGIVRGKLIPSFEILPVFEPVTGALRHATQIIEQIATRISKSRMVKRSRIVLLLILGDQTALQRPQPDGVSKGTDREDDGSGSAIRKVSHEKSGQD
jgi:hypothetical protein